MIDIKEILAVNLKEYRRKKGLTQEKLSEKADMSLHYLAMLELGRKFPSGEMLERLANALDIEPHQLVEVSATPEGAMERLHQAIVADIKQVVREAVKESIAEHCKAQDKT
ncbi:MAG: helix-turn-helix transcriptional regulator [Treponema sp.]|jgi:transcriptional regulator with XRE-family HTH domain|nr:helix-turn-helix transcriptional regulator [Treponema sp.]